MNKIVVSIIFAIILVLIIHKIADVIFYVEKPEKSAYQVANVTASGDVESAEANSEDSASGDIMALFASASSEEGEKVFKKCAACHTVTKDGGNKIGPALWSVLGRKAGALTDYKYPKAMSTYGKTWSFKEMDGFLLKPKNWIKGTKMSFAGIKNEKERAAIILYMNENTDSPLPIN